MTKEDNLRNLMKARAAKVLRKQPIRRPIQRNQDRDMILNDAQRTDRSMANLRVSITMRRIENNAGKVISDATKEAENIVP